MQTLKDISKHEVVKCGVGPRCDIPVKLREELERMEFNIQSGMTGRFHRHKERSDREDIEIFWDRRTDQGSREEWSQWRFVNHRNGNGAIVRASRKETAPVISQFLLFTNNSTNYCLPLNV